MQNLRILGKPLFEEKCSKQKEKEKKTAVNVPPKTSKGSARSSLDQNNKNMIESCHSACLAAYLQCNYAVHILHKDQLSEANAQLKMFPHC
jgi:hypothetical protein